MESLGYFFAHPAEKTAPGNLLGLIDVTRLVCPSYDGQSRLLTIVASEKSFRLLSDDREFVGADERAGSNGTRHEVINSYY